jgi:HK97 family phage portal protein
VILGRLLNRTASMPPPSPPPAHAAGLAANGLLWWSNPANGAFNAVDYGPDAGALGYVGIGRGVSLIADTLAGVPRHVYRGDVEQVSTPTWIADPGGVYTAPGGLAPGSLTPFDFYSQLFVSLLLWGNSYVWLDRRGFDGAPTVPMHVINPAFVTVESTGDRVDTYRIGSASIDPVDMLHVRARTLPGSAVGIGIVAQYREALAAMGALRGYAAATFGSGGVPAGVLKSEAPDLTQDEATRLKAAWMSAHGSGSRSIAVLNATTTFTPLSLPPEDAQFLGTQQFSLLEQALMVGVPPNFVGASSGDSMTYSNIESRFIELGRFSLLPWARRAEDALERYLPRGQRVRFVLDGLYRSDTKTRYEAHAIALAAGFMTVDEVRALENLAPAAIPAMPEVTP